MKIKFNYRSNNFLTWCTLLLLAILSIYGILSYISSKKASHIAIIQIVEHPALNATYQGIEDTLKDTEIQIEYQSAQGSSNLATQIAKQFVGAHPLLLVGIGTTATQALISADQYHSIPIVFSSVTDPKGSKIVQNLNHPEGVITGVSNFIAPQIQFDLFKKIMPHLRKLGIIYNPGESNSVALVEEMKKIAKEKGLELIFATANTTTGVIEGTHKLISAVEALFINNDNTALSAFDSIVQISTKHRIPVFSSDIDTVPRGALAAIGANQYEVGRQTGNIILQILNGKKPSDIPVSFPDKTEIQFNLEQSQKLRITIPATLLKPTKSNQIQEQGPT